jgi:transcriptional regulator with XRE-family HTH domain
MKNEEKIPANDLITTESKSVHQRFEVLIEALGLTRNKFAKELGMASTQIYSVINGRNAPSHKMYAAIVRVFPQVNINYLLVERGDPLFPKGDDVLNGHKNMNKLKNVEKVLEGLSDEALEEKFERFLQNREQKKVPVKKRKVKSKK